MAPDLVPVGRSIIDVHVRRDEIIQILAIHALTPTDKKIGWTTLSEELYAEFQLRIEPQALSTYVQRRVVPAVYVTPEFVRRGVVTGEFNLNTAEMKLRLAKKAYDEALNTTQVEDVDKDSNLFMRAISPGEKAVLTGNALKALESAESTLERFAIIPGKKVTVEKREMKADLRGAMGQAAGRRIVDIEVTATTKTIEETG